MHFSLNFKAPIVHPLLLLPMVGLLLTSASFSSTQVSQHQGTAKSRSPTIYYGVHVPGWLQDLSAVTAFERDIQKPAAIILWYQGWGVKDGSQNFEFTWMNNVRNHGSIPLISWEPWDYTQGIHQPAFSLQNIIERNFDSYITRWAQASKAWGHPYFLRFAHEMNANWYPWSELTNGNKPGQYIRAYRHVHDIFAAQGVTNVTWVWSPNVEYPGSLPLAGLYPGNSYVDWIGIDGYNWSTIQGHHWQSFSQVFQQTYNDILGMSPGKPLMIAETASAESGGDKAGWITDALLTQLPAFFPEVKAIVWFNENKETDWRVESSHTAQAAFASAIVSGMYASNQYAHLNASPIPIPT